MHFRALRRRTLQLLCALPLLARARPQAASIPAALGYLPWWMAPGWRAMALEQLDRLVLFDAPIRPDGALLDRTWEQRAAGFFGSANVAVEMALTLLEEGEFNALFTDSAARNRLLSEASRLLGQRHIAGLHLDIEAFSQAPSAAIAGFRQWLAALDQRRREAGKALSAFFPASDSFQPYDAAGAGRIDYWVAQLYDAHWQEAPVTGPLITRRVANAVAVPRALARLSALGVPPGKVLLSVPLYGWEWPSASEQPGAATRGKARLLTVGTTPEALMPNNRLVATELARRHGLRRDQEHTPYYAYREGRHWVQGWFEDLESLTLKFAPERAQGYAGLAFFTLGYDEGAIVQAMRRWWARPR